MFTSAAIPLVPPTLLLIAVVVLRLCVRVTGRTISALFVLTFVDTITSSMIGIAQ